MEVFLCNLTLSFEGLSWWALLHKLTVIQGYLSHNLEGKLDSNVDSDWFRNIFIQHAVIVSWKGLEQNVAYMRNWMEIYNTNFCFEGLRQCICHNKKFIRYRKFYVFEGHYTWNIETTSNIEILLMEVFFPFEWENCLSLQRLLKVLT